MFPHSTTRARGRVPEMLYIFLWQSVYKSLLSNESKSRVLKYSNILKKILGRQTEKNHKKKNLNRYIDFATIFYIKLPTSTAAPLVVNSMKLTGVREIEHGNLGLHCSTTMDQYSCRHAITSVNLQLILTLEICNPRAARLEVFLDTPQFTSENWWSHPWGD